jgi:cell division septum initiation protein DivIVA
MGSISGITSQLNSMGNCATPENCCEQINAIKSALNDLSNEISALTGGSDTARTALQKAQDALNEAGIAKAQANSLAGELGEVQNGLGELAALVAVAVGLARAAMAAVAPLGAAIAALGSQVTAIAAGLAALAASVAPLIVAVAAVGAIALTLAAVQTLAQSAYDLADTALKIGASAADQAATGILRSNAAQAAADAANRIGAAAENLASGAKSLAERAISAASGAQSTADRAIGAAGAAQSTADRAIGIASSIAAAPPIPGERGFPGIAGTPGLQGERGFPGASAPALQGERGFPGLAGAPGFQGERGFPGSAGAPGFQGERGFPGTAGTPGLQGERGFPGIAGTPGLVGAPGRDGTDGKSPTADPTIPAIIGVLKSKVEGLEKNPTISPPRPDGSIPITYPTTGTIVRVPQVEVVQGEFVEVEKKLTKFGGDMEPLKNDNEKNKSAIAFIQQNCCKPETETQPKVEITLTPFKQFVRCNPTTKAPEYAAILMPVIKGTELAEAEKARRLAEIEGQQCRDFNAIATVPEWWQLRPEAGRTQGIYVYKELRGDGTIGNDPYAITVPHCALTTAPGAAILPEYQKGNYQGVLFLKDNSKLVVNCVSEVECQRVIDKLSKVIKSDYLTGSTTTIGKHKGRPFKEIRVKAQWLHFFPTGAKSMKPAYIKSFF